MSEPSLSLEEDVLSPGLFSDLENAECMESPVNSDESSSTFNPNEPEPTDDIPEWKGMSMEEILKGMGVFDLQEHPPICPSANHTVLILLPLGNCGPPKPHPANQMDKWSQGYVRMPHSAHSLYPIDESVGNRRCRNRWELIQESLLQSFLSSHQLEAAILSYNHMYAQRWDFAALHHFFSEVVDEEDSQIFFEILMPKMVQLALQLPVLLTGAVPLLKRHTNNSISLSQLQAASLLANAFFCTFPRRNSSNPQSEYAAYPHINFNRLFSAYKEEKRNRCDSVLEKLKCLFHYFRRVTSKAPEGVITIQRRYIPKQDCPKWDRLDKKLPPFHITSKGTIENEGAGFLQVDFANRYVGGGVLGLGCVQEEIRFVICPELMVTMLVTEALDDTEALVVSGIERYSKYEGYSNHFKWTGDFVDETPRDSSGRRMTTVVAIDALCYKQPAAQFSINNVMRELNKAYVGFVGTDMNRDNLPAIATGNWGCGAFRGNPKLKVLLQLMAAAAAGRSMVYFTFGDTSLRDSIAEMYWHLVQHNVDIGYLFSLLSQYQSSGSKNHLDFYRFLYNRSKMKEITKYFPIAPAETQQKKPIIKSPDKINENNFTKDSTERNSPTISKEQETRDEKVIENWLMNFEENSTGVEESEKEVQKENGKDQENNSKQQEKSQVEAIQKSTKSEEMKEEVSEKRRKSLWKIIEDKVPSKIYYEKRLSALEIIGTKAPVANQKTTNHETTTTLKKSPPNQLNNEKGKHILKERPSQPQKNVSSLKKSGQRRISDFFQKSP